MSYKFTDEQLDIQQLVRDFTKKEVTPRDREMDVKGFDMELFHKYNEIGLPGTPIPEEYGGVGLSDVECAIIVHELAKGSASFAMSMEISWVCADMILRFGTEAQKQKYLPAIANGALFAFCLTEPGSGSDAAGMKSRAKKQADGSYIINGSKAWITNPGIADHFIIMAITDPEKGAHGISAFIVDKGQQGLFVDAEEDKMGMRGSDTHGLTFDDMHVPAEALLGEKEGLGFKMAMQGLDGGRVSCTAISTGLAEHAMDLAKAYAFERKTFGKPIAKHQAIAFKFADMATYIEAMKLMLYDVAEMKASGIRCSKEAAQAKLFASTNTTKICLEAIQILGGNGYSKEYDVERLLRDNKLMEIGEGTNEVLKIVISSAVLAK